MNIPLAIIDPNRGRTEGGGGGGGGWGGILLRVPVFERQGGERVQRGPMTEIGGSTGNSDVTVITENRNGLRAVQ